MLGFNKKKSKSYTPENTVVSAPENTETTAAPVSTDSNKIILIHGDKPVIWNLKEEPQKTISSTENAQEFRNQAHHIVQRNLAEHVAHHANELDYFVFDLKKDFVADEGAVAHIAITEEEAWDLSVALVQEMAHRKDNEDKGKKIIVVVNNAETLLSNAIPEDTDFYMQFLGNMKTILEEGQNHGVHVLAL